MQAILCIDFQFVVERGWLPRVGEEAEGDGFTKSVELETTAPDSVHDGGIMHYLNFDTALIRSYDKVGMGSGSTGVF